MSYPYFIKLPKEVIKNIYDIKYKDQNFVYPTRVKTIYLDYDEWLRLTKNHDSEDSRIRFKKEMTANDVKKNILDKILKNKFKAEQSFESKGGFGGYSSNLYIDENYEYVYFYTMNRYKTTKARRDFEDQKYFFIHIYKISYKVFDMLANQDKYEFLFNQKPSGFVYNIDLSSNNDHKWHSIVWKNRKNINWK